MFIRLVLHGAAKVGDFGVWLERSTEQVRTPTAAGSAPHSFSGSSWNRVGDFYEFRQREAGQGAHGHFQSQVFLATQSMPAASPETIVNFRSPSSRASVVARRRPGVLRTAAAGG